MRSSITNDNKPAMGRFICGPWVDAYSQVSKSPCRSIVDQIINFQSVLVDVLLFCWPTFYFQKTLSCDFLVFNDPVYSSMERVTEMMSGNLVHGSRYGHAE